MSSKSKKREARGGFWRSFNHQYPWFKVLVVGLVVFCGMMGTAKGLQLDKVRGNIEAHDSGMATTMTVDLKAEPTDLNDYGLGTQKVDTEHSARIYASGRPKGMKRDLVDKKLIALTFDDGPTKTVTPRLLEILREKKVHVTFFTIGIMAEAAPDLLKAEEAAGHVVGSHTMRHTNLASVKMEEIRDDTVTMEKLIRDVLGHGPGLTRPPYGNITEEVRTTIKQPLVIWSIDPEDWKVKDAAKIRQHVVEKAFDGAVVLLHDCYDTTADAVGGIIDDLRKAGYEMVTIPELAQARGIKMERGEVYGKF